MPLCIVVSFVTIHFSDVILEQLNVLELFLDCMTEQNEKLVESGVGGICNSCAGNSSSSTLRDINISTWFIYLIVDKKD